MIQKLKALLKKEINVTTDAGSGPQGRLKAVNRNHIVVTVSDEDHVVAISKIVSFYAVKHHTGG